MPQAIRGGIVFPAGSAHLTPTIAAPEVAQTGHLSFFGQG